MPPRSADNQELTYCFLKCCSESEKVSGGGVVNFCSGCLSESGKGGTVAASKSKRIPCSTNIYYLILQRICWPNEPIQAIFFIKFWRPFNIFLTPKTWQLNTNNASLDLTKWDWLTCTLQLRGFVSEIYSPSLFNSSTLCSSNWIKDRAFASFDRQSIKKNYYNNSSKLLFL